MAYCRLSDDDYQCDVYCYQGHNGFVIHVARSRPVLDVTLPPKVPLTEATTDEWLARHKAVMAWIENAVRVPIGLPYDGETFRTGSASDAADTLEMLKSVGYNVPQYAIDALRNEEEE